MSDSQKPESENIEVHDPTGEIFQVAGQLPVLAVRDVIIFPGVTVPLTVGR